MPQPRLPRRFFDVSHLAGCLMLLQSLNKCLLNQIQSPPLSLHSRAPSFSLTLTLGNSSLSEVPDKASLATYLCRQRGARTGALQVATVRSCNAPVTVPLTRLLRGLACLRHLSGKNIVGSFPADKPTACTGDKYLSDLIPISNYT